mgnify:CR=1 FL=1
MQELCACIKDAVRVLGEAGPKVITAWSQQQPVLLFTDGACEESGRKVTHGALLVDTTTSRYEYFGDDVPMEWADSWRQGGKRQLVGQAEIFPLLVAKVTWPDVFKGRRVIWFADNESARIAVVRGFSPSLQSSVILRKNAEADVKLGCCVWASRVPTKSNPSDAASRLDFRPYESSFVWRQPVYPSVAC